MYFRARPDDDLAGTVTVLADTWIRQGLPPSLQELDLSWNPLGATARTDRLLAVLPRLETLRLAHTDVAWPVAGADPVAFGDATTLRTADMTASAWTAPSLAAWLARQRGLRQLVLDAAVVAGGWTTPLQALNLGARSVSKRPGDCGHRSTRRFLTGQPTVPGRLGVCALPYVLLRGGARVYSLFSVASPMCHLRPRHWRARACARWRCVCGHGRPCACWI